VTSKSISVIDPINPAFERVKLLLFSPFDLGKWFVVGFCAWLAYMGKGQPTFTFHYPAPFDGEFSCKNGCCQFPSIHNFFNQGFVVIIPLICVAVIAAIAIGVVLMWLSSRGQFMFLHCVVLNRAEVKLPWNSYRRQGNSLFLFRLVIGILFVVFLLIFAVVFFAVVMVCKTDFKQADTGLIAGLIISSITLSVFVVFLALVVKFTYDFVVPIMYLHGCSCVQGWKRFLDLLRKNKGAFVLYILFQIVIHLAIFAIVTAIVLLSCCCAGIFLSIPYIGTVLMLPVHVFNRSYSLYYLSQFGSDYDVFRLAA